MTRPYSPFVRKYRSQAFKVARRRAVFLTTPGMFYVRVWNLCAWRDGWKFGVAYVKEENI